MSLQHGESEFNLSGKIGGDANLSNRGEAYARKLPELVRQSVGVSISLSLLLAFTYVLRMTVLSRSGHPP
jgi:6-phosphofructo-2-kinase/fructose-2,6-biphosphatase 2